MRNRIAVTLMRLSRLVLLRIALPESRSESERLLPFGRHPVWRGARLIFLMTALCSVLVVGAAEYHATPLDYRLLLKQLNPGDTLELAPGDYDHGLPLHGLAGAPGSPIVIRGPRTTPYARFIARPGAHTVSIINSAWIEIHNLELDGRGLPVNAVRAEAHSNWAHHITLERLTITGHGEDQSVAGIATFCPTWGWSIRNNIIVGAGTGMYLGNSDGSAPFVGGLIEHNVIVDTIGYNLQIKHQNERPRIAGMPVEKSITIIRHNVFSKSAKSSSGKMARPNLLVGHWPLSGPGAEDFYAIYGNFFYQNPSEALFQGEGNVVFYSNVLVNTRGDAINIQPHNAVPRHIDIFHNTVIAAATGIRVSGGDPAYTQQVVANAVFASTPIIGGAQQANKTGPLAAAANYLTAPFAPLGQLDLSPRLGRLTTGPFNIAQESSVPDLYRDFDGRMYSVPIAGAYSGNGPPRRLLIDRHMNAGAWPPH